MARKKSYDEGSLADLANRALERLKRLSKSQKISDKLIAFNLILFILILGLDISYWLGANPNQPFSFLVFLIVSMVFSSIGSLVYGPALEIISNLTINKIESLRIAIAILFTDLSISLVGVLFSISLMVNISAAIIGVQVVILLFGSFIGFSSEPKIEDKRIESNQLRMILGDIASIITIINFIIWIGSFVVKFI